MPAHTDPILRRSAAAALAALLLAPFPAAGQEPAAAPAAEAAETAAADAGGFVQTLDADGVAVEVRIDPLGEATRLIEGGDVRVSVSVEDGHTGRPLSGLFPAAWMDLVPPGAEEGEDACKQRIEGFLGGALISRAELDLNVFYVLTLNEDATVSVVDPLFGFGGSKLLARVRLPGPGYDWVLTPDQEWLYVSVPESDVLAVVETASWQMLTRVEVDGRPERLALQPDGAFLWATYAGEGEAGGGVSIVGARSFKEVARVATGAGPHALAFSADGRFAFVANAGAGTVTVIDAARREKVRDLAVGGRPVALDVSAAAGALYVSDAAGAIVAIDGEGREVLARIAVEPGLGTLRVTPDGRWALALDPGRDTLYVVDTASNRVVQSGELEDQPREIAFSDELAYVSHAGSDLVLTLPLASLGAEGQPLQVIDFTGGTAPAGQRPATTAASGMAQAPGAPAMLVANFGDGSIYYYKEGMAAPMGQFKNYGRRPRAVTVVDRSLDERQPGVYSTAARLRRPGEYRLAFFLDSPRIVHCFPLEVAEDPVAAAARQATLAVEPLDLPLEVAVGETVDVAYRLVDPRSGAPITGLDDVTVLAVLSPGIWHDRAHAEEVGDGVYRLRFAPPRDGVYYVYVASPSRALDFNDGPQRAFRVVAAPSAAAASAAGDARRVVSVGLPRRAGQHRDNVRLRRRPGGGDEDRAQPGLPLRRPAAAVRRQRPDLRRLDARRQAPVH
ncbi:MAG TPA: YncE family protein, partial [Thermoanaerobaculia bacterium]|nr:YncE family protein [Thermoanaerobaculia bacterium]